METVTSEQAEHIIYKNLRIERFNDHVAQITLFRPEAMNTLNTGLMLEIEAAVEYLNADVETRVVIFTGTGDNFSAGADLKEKREPGTVLEYMRKMELGPRMIEKIFNMNPITIAAINGAALGGGACICSACDFRIGSRDCQAGFPENKLGINLSWRALPLVMRLIGSAAAKEMVILGKGFEADTLLKWGFISEILPKNRLLDRALEMACEYAALPPISSQMIKKSINQLSSAVDNAVMHMDSDQYLLAAFSEDFKEGVNAFFEKRPGVFKGN